MSRPYITRLSTTLRISKSIVSPGDDRLWAQQKEKINDILRVQSEFLAPGSETK